jgi:hypothetical protein
MYSGIIQTAITKRLPLELDYRQPSDSKTGIMFQESTPGNTEYRDRPRPQEIEFDRRLI